MFTSEIMSWLFKDPNHVLFKDSVVIIKEIMSRLFKDPIVTVVLLNFDHAQSRPKTKFPQIKFLLEKHPIKFSCTYQP